MADLLDRQLLHALQVDGRAAFSRIAEVLGVSDHTVARRYDRLRSTGSLRVRGLLEPSKVTRTQWIVRVRCIPRVAGAVAAVLARRPDTSWISLTAGGTELVCVIDVPNHVGYPAPLWNKLPADGSILAIDAHCVLHEFFGGTRSLVDKNGPLTAAQVGALRPPPPPARPGDVRPPDAGDDLLVRALRNDGRATGVALASATGWSQSTVRRRVAELVSADLLYFSVDFDQDLFDLRMRAVLWLRVAPDQLAGVGEALAGHPEVGYVAATTGSTNLYCAVSCPTAEALYRYLTGRLAHISAIQQLETAAVVRSVKPASVLSVSR